MQRKPLVCPDSSMLFGPITDRMQPEHRDRIHRVFTRYRALLAVPLIVGDEVWGALGIYYDEPRAFSAEDDRARVATSPTTSRSRSRTRSCASTPRRRPRPPSAAGSPATCTTPSRRRCSRPASSPRCCRGCGSATTTRALERLEELRQLTRGALAEMRTLLLELRPAALVEADLADVLRQLGRGRRHVGPAGDVMVEGEPRRLPPEQQVALYRIAQEALNNVAKHGRRDARRRHAALRGPGACELTVADDGRGFDRRGRGGDHHGLRHHARARGERRRTFCSRERARARARASASCCDDDR